MKASQRVTVQRVKLHVSSCRSWPLFTQNLFTLMHNYFPICNLLAIVKCEEGLQWINKVDTPFTFGITLINVKKGCGFEFHLFKYVYTVCPGSSAAGESITELTNNLFSIKTALVLEAVPLEILGTNQLNSELAPRLYQVVVEPL